MGVFLHEGEHCRGQGVHRAGQGVAGTPSTSGWVLEIRARHELYRDTSVRCSSVSPLRIRNRQHLLGIPQTLMTAWLRLLRGLEIVRLPKTAAAWQSKWPSATMTRVS